MTYEEFVKKYKPMKEARKQCPGYGGYCGSCMWNRWATETKDCPPEAEIESRCELAKRE